LRASLDVVFFYLPKLCGPVKSWKRAQDPSDGTPRRFGFCEFESAEGVLRALRLLTKCSVDGEELVVCLYSCIILFAEENFFPSFKKVLML